MFYWISWARVVKGRFCFAMARVVVDPKRGDVVDAGVGLERFIGGKFHRMWEELENAGWKMEPK